MLRNTSKTLKCFSIPWSNWLETVLSSSHSVTVLQQLWRSTSFWTRSSCFYQAIVCFNVLDTVNLVIAHYRLVIQLFHSPLPSWQSLIISGSAKMHSKDTIFSTSFSIMDSTGYYVKLLGGNIEMLYRSLFHFYLEFAQDDKTLGDDIPWKTTHYRCGNREIERTLRHCSCPSFMREIN